MKKYIKILVLMTSVMFIAQNTKAQVANQYVKWASVPNNPEPIQVVAWYKTALTGGDIAGADVRATKDHYKYVYGEKIVAEMNAASPSSFMIDKAKGNELNWGISQNGTPIQKGTIPAGTLLIWFNSPSMGWIPVAKWGENGCFNPVSLPKQRDFANLNDGEDPDVARGNGGPKGNSGSYPGNINITLTTDGNSSSRTQTSQISYEDGERIFMKGGSFASDYIDKGYQMGKSCCNGGNTGQSSGYFVSNNNSSRSREDFTEEKEVDRRFIETFVGHTLSTAAGTAGGILIVRAIDGLLYRIRYGQNRYYVTRWNNTWNNNNGGGGRFEGPDFPSTGYSGNNGNLITGLNQGYSNLWNANQQFSGNGNQTGLGLSVTQMLSGGTGNRNFGNGQFGGNQQFRTSNATTNGAID